MWVSGRKFEIIEAKTEAEAFMLACKKFGINNFTGFRRYFEGQTSRDHTDYFLKRAISNPVKHKHKMQKRK